MDNAYVQALRKEAKKAFKNNKARYWHTIGVANTCACLAMRYGVDMERAFVAGLLHDCAKCYSDQELLKACENYSIDISPSENVSPYLLHAKLGAYLAEHEYSINDSGILDAITYHTTGRPDMTMLEKIIYIADYIEPNRAEIPGLNEVRFLAFEDIDQAVCRSAGATTRYLQDGGKAVDPMTIRTYNFYKKE